MSYVVDATISVEVTDPASLPTAAAGNVNDQRAQVQAAVDLGLKELASLAGRYGFKVSDAAAKVRPED